MHKLFSMTAALALALGAVPVSAQSANVAAAVANAAARSDANVKLDESRKPAEVLKFLGLKRGMRVSDPFGGNFYWAEIIGPAVGPKGRISVWSPKFFARVMTLCWATMRLAS